ncbi:MAG: hypothetical protein IBX50_19445 [Marinospirillum sp.]|uniref:hypothetical protein n=1 Tax=Marinospirillum sp. TaxID=2183934 RepID=UPI001A00A1D0|nr:hypothetical protein [Marinospirillum sp.]MBE0508865.1 hypothetical protein [Marinospirillum sp.]
MEEINHYRKGRYCIFWLHSHLVFTTKYRGYMKNALWSPSDYAGGVGGAAISVIRQYIEQKTRPIREATASQRYPSPH